MDLNKHVMLSHSTMLIHAVVKAEDVKNRIEHPVVLTKAEQLCEMLTICKEYQSRSNDLVTKTITTIWELYTKNLITTEIKDLLFETLHIL